MFSTATREIRQLHPRLVDLLRVLAGLSGRSADEVSEELESHLAARICFLLLGELDGASSFEVIQRRLTRRLQRDSKDMSDLVQALASTLVSIDSADLAQRSTLLDLPYPTRQKLLALQRGRCAICGWEFGRDLGTRTPYEAYATLDHRDPYRLGGDQLSNLRILCGLCNSVKEAAVHVGEQGRVWINNHVYGSPGRAAAFWAMARDSRCRIDLCDETARSSRLFAQRIRGSGPLILDNLTVRCSTHADQLEAIPY
jgi:hypothetical protein